MLGVSLTPRYLLLRPGGADLFMINELTTNTTFADLGVGPELLSVLTESGFVEPFPIQAITIPDGLAGLDVLGKAKTGSGKTLAFGLPIAEGLERAKPFHPKALVLVPTREPVSYTHLRAHETVLDLVCRLLLEKKKK